MKAKVDKYKVFGKRRSYEILMFPNYQNMHVYDEHPREDTYRIDGDKEVVSALAIAVAILAEDPSKVIYFPGKKGGFGTGYEFNYHLVMARPELQFRRSEWYRLKPQLNKTHWKGKYVFSYHPGKLLDYYKQLKSDWRWKEWEKEDYKKWVEEVLGDTVFWILPRNFCYQDHAYLLDDLKDLQEKDFDVRGGLCRIFAE